MAGGREPRHVRTGLGDDHLVADLAGQVMTTPAKLTPS
jgi:hypothetical protein